MNDPPSSPRSTPDRSLHWAFATVAILLALLILVTPALEEGIPAGGTLLSQGVLYVSLDRTGNVSLLLEGLGHVTFSSLAVGVNRSAHDVPGNATSVRQYLWTNVSSQVAEVVTVSGTGFFVVNVSTVYDSGGQLAESQGVFGLWLSPFPLTPSSTLTVIPVWPLSGPVTLPQGTSARSYPVGSLPQPLDLLLAPYPVVTPPGGPSA
jgi:hypothetical protein